MPSPEVLRLVMLMWAIIKLTTSAFRISIQMLLEFLYAALKNKFCFCGCDKLGLFGFQETLKALGNAAYPGEELFGLISEQWKEMGWQGKDPSTDFRYSKEHLSSPEELGLYIDGNLNKYKIHQVDMAHIFGL